MNQAHMNEDDYWRQTAGMDGILPPTFAQYQLLEQGGVPEEVAALQRAFTVDIFRLLAEKETAEDRFRTAERTLMAELARQRDLSASLQADLEHARMRSMLERDRYLADTRELKAQLDGLRKRNAILENLVGGLVTAK